MKNRINRLLEKKGLSYIFVLFIVFVPQGICALKAVPYSTYDEIGPLKFLGYITGESNLGNLEAAYYGWGTYIWMFPAYFLTHNPICRYRALCIFSVLLQTLSAELTLIVCNKYLIKKMHIIYSICISVMVGYTCSHDIIIYNEHGLLFINCLVLLLICKAFSDEKRKAKYTFCAFLVALYGLTIHTRAIILIIALISIVLAYHLFFKINLLNKKQIIALFIIGIFVRRLVKTVEHMIWVRYSSTGSVANTSVGLTMDKIKCIFGLDFWKTIWTYCFGQIYALNIITGGVIILVFFSFTVYIINSKFDLSKLEFQRNLFIILVFGMCTAALMVGVGMNWGAPLYMKPQDIYGTNAEALKGIHYTRYSLNYSVPLCILALAISLDNFIYKRKYGFCCIIGQIVCYIYWYDYIYPKVKNSYGSITYLVGIMHRTPYTGIPYERLFIIIFFTFNIVILSSLINKKILYYLFLDGLLLYSFMGSFYCDTYQYQLIRSEYQRASYQYLMEQLTDEEFRNIDKIYAYNVDWAREQFYITQAKIVEGIPEKSESEAIIMYHGNYLNDEDFLRAVSVDDYQIYKMEEECFLLVRGGYLDLFCDGYAWNDG